MTTDRVVRRRALALMWNDVWVSSVRAVLVIGLGLAFGFTLRWLHRLAPHFIEYGVMIGLALTVLAALVAMAWAMCSGLREWYRNSLSSARWELDEEAYESRRAPAPEASTE